MGNLAITTPYMLRNDGALLECDSIHPYILMSVKSSLETNVKTLNGHPEFLEWFYDNTLQEKVKELIDEYKKTNNFDLLEELNVLTNNEFCRVRTSNYKVPYGGDNGQIYFRISSNNNFNWFDLIYDVVLQYENIDYITIVKDAQAFKDVKDFDYYKIENVEINQLPIEEFLTIQGNPIVENVDNNILDEARRGQTSLKLVMVEVAKELYPDIDFSQPATWCIHHVDGNDKNNSLINISLMKRGNHTSLHSAIRYKKLEKIKDLEKSILYVGRDLINKTKLEGTASEEKILNDSYIKAKNALIEYNKSNLLEEEIIMDSNNQNKVKSNGIYSVLNNEWIKEPVQSDIPDINQKEFEKLFKEWEDKYFDLLEEIKNKH